MMTGFEDRGKDKEQGTKFSVPDSPILFKSDISSEERDRILWNGLRQGNKQALDFIFEKNIRMLYAYGNKITQNTDLVEDCIQDVFVELWTRRGRLSDTDSIKFYLFKSVRRRIANRLGRDQKNQRLIEEWSDKNDDFEPAIEASFIRDQNDLEQKDALKVAMSNLSKRQREAVHLKFYEKMTYGQLAEILDIDIKSSYKLIGKAIDALRKSVRTFT